MDHTEAAEIIADLYHTYSDDIFKYIVFLLGDRDKAEDLTHDTFLQAFKSLRSYKGQASPKTWLFRIARNVTVDHIRRQQILRRLKIAWRTFVPAGHPPPAEIVEQNEQEAELYRALNQLNEKYRTVIYFRKIKEFSTAETAEILGWTPSNVRTTLHRALLALKKQLEKEGWAHEIL